MKVLDTFFLKSRGTIIFCAPDRLMTMDDVASKEIHVIRGDERWRVIGIERHCIAPRPGQTVGLLLRGECHILKDEDVELSESAS